MQCRIRPDEREGLKVAEDAPSGTLLVSHQLPPAIARCTLGARGANGTRKRCVGSFMSFVPLSQALMSEPKITAVGRVIRMGGTAFVRKSAA